MTSSVDLTIFREYDIRGVMDEQLSEHVVKLMGYVLGGLLQESSRKVCIAYDIRTHSPKVCSWLMSGLNASGVEIHNAQMSATPVSYFANYIDSHDFDMTVMITASHNPSDFNGFKITKDKKPFFGEEITQLGLQVKSLCEQGISIDDDNSCIQIDLNSLYVETLANKFTHLKNLKQLVVIDSGNGSAGFLMARILDKIGLECEHLYSEPDGNFPNHHPDPTDEKNLVDLKEKMGYSRIGFAFDGDGDRLAVLTPKHNIKGDLLAIIFAKQMPKPIVVGEVKCSTLMYDLIGERGEVYMHKTGHSNIKQKMQEVGANLGAEVSGHLFFADDYFGYDDAMYACLRVMDLIYKGVDLDQELDKLPVMYSTPELKHLVAESNKFSIVNALSDLIGKQETDLPPIISVVDIDGLRINFENGWGLVRASNTTSHLITRFEAKSDADLNLYKEKLTNLINKCVKAFDEH